jgi:ubiquinone/menaquinone biosynthesis C-methylase UbiE
MQIVVPWVLSGRALGARVLEIGPGFGATAKVLQKSVDELTVVEIDPKSVRHLASVLDSSVSVVQGDGANMAFDDESFDSTVCFAMMHHVPSVDLQDALIREAFRVTAPGGVFVGSDITDTWLMRLAHVRDTMVLVPPESMERRLADVGFVDIDVDATDLMFRWYGRKP